MMLLWAQADARAGGQAARDGGALVDLVDDLRVVLRECDAVSHKSSSLLLVQSGDLAPALHRRALVRGRACVQQPHRARLGRRGGALAEQPRFRRLQLLDVVVVIGKKGARLLDVVHARELQLEPYALLVALAAHLVHLGAQLLAGVGGLCRVGGLALERRNLRVTLGEQGLVVRAGVDIPSRQRFARRRSHRLCRSPPWHPRAPWSPPQVLGRPMPPACPQPVPVHPCHCSRRPCTPALSLGRAAKSPHLIGTGIIDGCHKAARWLPANNSREHCLENDKQISGSSGYSNIEFCFGAALKFCRRIAKPFLHIPRGEDDNVVKSQAF